MCRYASASSFCHSSTRHGTPTTMTTRVAHIGMHTSQVIKIGWQWKWKTGGKNKLAKPSDASIVKRTYIKINILCSHHNFRLSLSIPRLLLLWILIQLTSKSHFVSNHWIKRSHISFKIRAHDNHDDDATEKRIREQFHLSVSLQTAYHTTAKSPLYSRRKFHFSK